MKKENLAPFTPTLFTSLRAKMGDRWFYLGIMTFSQIANCVRRVNDIHEKRELKTWIQRELRPERTEQIATYLTTQNQHFFNAIVLGIYLGDPEWMEIKVTETVKIKELKLDDHQAAAFGVIHLSGHESIFAIDGQHRVEGIKKAVAQNPKIGSEEQAVIFIAHKMTHDGRERTRRLFSTLNAYARPVPESELVALSEDDVYAKVTRKLIDDYKGLSIEFAPILSGANIPATEKTCITTVVGLYHLTQTLAPKEIRRAKKKHQIGPIDPEAFTAILAATTSYWDALKKHVLAVRKVCASSPSEHLASHYRHEEGGNLLFRTIGMKTFARATRTLMDRGESADVAVSRLAKLPLELDAILWRDVLWKPENKTMVTRFGRLAHNILLHKLGEKPDGINYSVATEYRRITGRKFPR